MMINFNNIILILLK